MRHRLSRRWTPGALCAAIALGCSPNAGALVFTWNGGDYFAAGLPDPIDSVSVVNAVSGNGKTLTGILTNNGLINWKSSNPLNLLGNGTTTLRNNGTFDQQADGAITSQFASTFDNAGTLLKSGGSGNLAVNVTLINRSGASLDAASGSIVYRNNSSFESGTLFKGSGTHVFSGVQKNFDFGGNFSGANNLLFESGVYNATVLTKPQTDVTFSAGTFNGSWTIDKGRTLTAIDAGTGKSISGSFVNDGNIAWKSSNPLNLLGNGTTTLRNNGTFDQQADGAITSQFASTFDNAGTLKKTAGDGDLRVRVGLVNSGAIESLSGNIVLPDNWRNDGILRGNARFQTNVLTNAGNVAPGMPDAANAVATLALTGKLVERATGTLSFDVGAGGLSDVFNVSSTVAFDGKLRVTRFGDYQARVGDTFRVMNFASFSGSLLDIEEFGFGNGVEFVAVYSPTFLELRVGVAPVPEPGTWTLMGGGALLVVWLRRRNGRSLEQSP